MRRGPAVAAATVAVLAVAACGAVCGASDATESAAAGPYPMTVKNCGRRVTINKQPRRVVAFDGQAATLVYAAGGVGRLAARADKAHAPYPRGLDAAVRGLPQLGSSSQVSLEALVATKPDLVIGNATTKISPTTLGPLRIPMLNQTGFCGTSSGPGTGDGDSDFTDAYNDIALYGRVFGTPRKAAAGVAALRSRVAAVVRKGKRGARNRTAAVLYVAAGGPPAAYGRGSMANTQVETLGFTNVFEGVQTRVFETSYETILAKDPDVVVLETYPLDDRTNGRLKREFLHRPELAHLTAVRKGDVMIQHFQYSGQGTLAVTGLEAIARAFLGSG